MVILAVNYYLFVGNPFEKKDAGENKELSTVISPARDLTGRWGGSAEWTNNVANPACNYKGKYSLNLVQTGNNLAGEFTSTIGNSEQLIEDVPCSPEGTQATYPLTGRVSSSQFEFSVANIEFKGSFTSDLMQGRLESCPNQLCSDGTNAVGFTGDFSLIREN